MLGVTDAVPDGIKTFFKISESVIATQKDFRAHFMLGRNDALRDRTKTFFFKD